MEQWAFILATALAASTLAAVTGTGGGVLLLPVLASMLGVREAVPVYTLAQLIGNASRVLFNRRHVCLPVVAWFSLGAVPLAILGAWLFTIIPDAALTRILGMFLLGSVIVRRWCGPRIHNFRPFWFAPIGAVFSTISAVVGSAGPFLAPFYLAHGLVKGAFIGTEALGTAMMHIVKLTCYQGLGAMSASTWMTGLIIGPFMITGSYLGKRILDRVPQALFVLIVECAVVVFAVWFLVK